MSRAWARQRREPGARASVTTLASAKPLAPAMTCALALALMAVLATPALADDRDDCDAARLARETCRRVAADDCVASRQRVVLACAGIAATTMPADRQPASRQPASPAVDAAVPAGPRARPTMGLAERPAGSVAPDGAAAGAPDSAAFDVDAANRAQVDRIAGALSRGRGIRIAPAAAVEPGTS